MWHTIVNFIPGWRVLVQGVVVFIVPLAFTLAFDWLRVKEGHTSRRGIRAVGPKGGGVPSAQKPGEKVQKSSHSPSGNKNDTQTETGYGKEAKFPDMHFTGCFQEDLQQLQCISKDMSDVIVREFSIGPMKIKAALFFVAGLSDIDGMDRDILKPLMYTHRPFDGMTAVPDEATLKEIVVHQVVGTSVVEFTDHPMQSFQKVLFGSIVLLVENMTEVMVLGIPKGRTRGGEEPTSEALLRGPRIGFSETLNDNTALLRRHGQTTELAMISFTVGKRIQKELVLVYMKDIANEELVEEVKRRIRTIDIDDVQESGFIEQLIEDNYLSPFQQIQNTERPDRVMAALLEGRVSILLDGTPFALIMPVTFAMLLQSPEDYYDRWLPGSLLRSLRFFAAFVSLFGPALYISFLSFHPGLIPTKLVISIISSRQGVPFATLIEALIMEISIEILREAGLRLPKPIGPAMGIVGGLIIGQAAVEAGIVSPILVIVVAVTAISSFSMPMYSAGITLRLLRFAAMFSAAVFGLYGVVLFFLLVSSHVVQLKSFGVPYVGLEVPYRMSDWKDFFIRLPLQFSKRRPALFKTKNPIRKG